MYPCLMMAALVIWSRAESFPRYRERTMLTHFTETFRARWFEESVDVCPVVRNGFRSPQRCGGAQWRRQGTISIGFINGTEIVSAATSPSCSIEITCYQVNFLRNHNGTKSEEELLGNAFLFGINVANMKRQHRKVLLATGCGTAK